MKLLSSNTEDIEEAARAIKAGKLAAFPTETVYGLGGDAFNPLALAKIFEAKQRPRFDPLIVHIASIDGLKPLVDFSKIDEAVREKLDALIKVFWPGPLTFILPKKPEVPDLATSGLLSVAVRFPDHPVAQKLIELSSGAVAAPSANPFGYLSPTRAEHVAEQLGERVDYIIDGGAVRVGVESTVLDMSGKEVRILRPGGLARESIEEIIGAVELHRGEDHLPNSPGLLKSHYAPRTPLELYSHEEMMKLDLHRGEAYVFFNRENSEIWRSKQSHNTEVIIHILSEAGNLAEAAANLFSLLHKLDHDAFKAIHIERVPDEGLGLAINDRLFKARAQAKNSI
ncbi:MAG: threonylcarbamoyl-AMP synthase [Treponema sp.]|nr:threonylcarbamoyl-AMP synthase [Treponema sp.]